MGAPLLYLPLLPPPPPSLDTRFFTICADPPLAVNSSRAACGVQPTTQLYRCFQCEKIALEATARLTSVLPVGTTEQHFVWKPVAVIVRADRCCGKCPVCYHIRHWKIPCRHTCSQHCITICHLNKYVLGIKSRLKLCTLKYTHFHHIGLIWILGTNI